MAITPDGRMEGMMGKKHKGKKKRKKVGQVPSELTRVSVPDWMARVRNTDVPLFTTIRWGWSNMETVSPIDKPEPPSAFRAFFDEWEDE